MRPTGPRAGTERDFVKRVLVLAFYFPPQGGAGVQRTVKFVKYLREFGYEATVVTGPTTAQVHWAPPDPALATEVPPDLLVLRAVDPPPLGARHPVRRWLRLPIPFERWWRHEATRLGRTVVRDVHLVYASMSPFGTAAVAAALAREGGKPWIADLRDPWALDDWTVYPTALHRRLEQRRMRRDLRSACAVILNTDEAEAAFKAQLPEFRNARVVTIPNGWDRADFDRAPAARNDGRFRVVYTGHAHDESARRFRGLVKTLLGGTVRGLNARARSHLYLVRALERLYDLDPELASRTELHIAGAVSGRLESDGRVQQHGYLRHDEAIALMRSADVLFLPMHDLTPGMRTRTVPSKAYEYLASGRPILAALPDGDARDLLEGLPSVWLCRPTDVDSMAVALREMGRAGHLTPPRLEVVERFERRRLAGRLAAVFDEVLFTAQEL